MITERPALTVKDHTMAKAKKPVKAVKAAPKKAAKKPAAKKK